LGCVFIKQTKKKKEIPRVVMENPSNLFAVVNALHFLTGKVYATRDPQSGRKLLTSGSAAQEEAALAFFSAELVKKKEEEISFFLIWWDR
jgi:hypothetical protein